MSELLIEILSEEIPARMQLQAARDFGRLMEAHLKSAGVTHSEIDTYVGPRRLVLTARYLPKSLAASTELLKGPREGAPEAALQGFLRKAGVTMMEVRIENGVYIAEINRPGRAVSDILSDALRDIMMAFPWPKSMRSGFSVFKWVRPIKSILFLLDGQILSFECDGIVAGNQTRGHRFLGVEAALTVFDFASYQKALSENSVILDHAERQVSILDQARKVCTRAGLELIEDQGLLEEVAGLNEYPVAILGDMDPKFLTLPPEVIKTSMRTHQKYFAVRKQDGTMAPNFVIVANIKSKDGGEEIRRGNAKVLSARLSDGVFFYSEDRKAGNFARWNEKLKGVTFHAKLGTLAQRVARIMTLAEALAPLLGVPVAQARQAAENSKGDLASYMVGEFPELQGIMGGYYARAAGLSDAVADAIRDHYKPLGPSDSLPVTPLGACLALADKLDTLISFFAIDEKPTGSKDPYALRRSALGVIRVILDYEISVRIDELVEYWHSKLESIYSNFREDDDREIFHLSNGTINSINIAQLKSWIKSFLVDRLKVMMRDEGLRPDCIEAAMAVPEEDLRNIVTRTKALEAVLAIPEGEDLVALHKRAANILAATKGDWTLVDLTDYPDIDSTEQALIAAVKGVSVTKGTGVIMENTVQYLKTLAALRKSVDSFLDEVLVNAPEADIRNHRLSLLKGVINLSAPIADLTKLT